MLRGWAGAAGGPDVPVAVDEVVDEPVDNPSSRGITVRVVWISVWIREIFKIAARNLLRTLS
jgi:hypothetical protein